MKFWQESNIYDFLKHFTEKTLKNFKSPLNQIKQEDIHIYFNDFIQNVRIHSLYKNWSRQLKLLLNSPLQKMFEFTQFLKFRENIIRKVQNVRALHFILFTITIYNVLSIVINVIMFSITGKYSFKKNKINCLPSSVVWSLFYVLLPLLVYELRF